MDTIEPYMEFSRSPLYARIQAALHRERRRGWRRWLVNDFACAPLEQATEEDLAGLHVRVCALAQVSGPADWSLAMPPLSRDALTDLQTEIRRGLDAMLNRLRWVVEPARVVAIVVEPARALTSPWTYYLGRPDAVRVPMTVGYPDAESPTLERRFLRRAAEELAPYIHNRIRRCHWCGEIFARRGRRDLFCSTTMCAQKERDNRKLPKGRKALPPFLDKVERVESTRYAERRRRGRALTGAERKAEKAAAQHRAGLEHDAG